MESIHPEPNYPSVIRPYAKDALHLGHMLTEIETELAWATGRIYEGHTIRKSKDHWLLVLRASQGITKLVAFFEGDTMIDAYRALWHGLYHKDIKWKRDRYR